MGNRQNQNPNQKPNQDQPKRGGQDDQNRKPAPGDREQEGRRNPDTGRGGRQR